MSKRILIITGVAADAKTLEDVLHKAEDGPFEIEWLTRLADALKRLSAGGVDAMLEIGRAHV